MRTPGRHQQVGWARRVPVWPILVLLAGLVVAALPANGATPAPDDRAAMRDSLRAEIARYAEMVAALKDSVAALDGDDAARRQRMAELDAAVAEITRSIAEVTDQIARIEMQVEDGRISFSDGEGGRLSVTIPEDFGEQLGRGLESITRVILEEIPDTVHVGDREAGFNFTWDGRGVGLAPAAPKPPRVIEGGLVGFQDDITVAADELVLGDVVAVMSDAVIEGKVQGDVVVVMGALTLGEGAVVDGEVVSVMSSLDRAESAQVGSMTVINPGPALLPGALTSFGSGWISFWSWQLLFVLLAMLTLFVLALAPRHRLDAVMATAAEKPVESLGLGLVAALAGHALVVGLGVILAVTVIGIPVALLVVLLVALLDLAAVGIGALLVGRRACAAFGWGCGHTWRSLMLGLVILHVPALLAFLVATAGMPVGLALLLTWLSRLIKFLAFSVGLGALLISRLGGRRRPAVNEPLEPVIEGAG